MSLRMEPLLEEATAEVIIKGHFGRGSERLQPPAHGGVLLGRDWPAKMIIDRCLFMGQSLEPG